MWAGSILGYKYSQVSTDFGKIDKASFELLARFLMSKVAINLAQDFWFTEFTG